MNPYDVILNSFSNGKNSTYLIMASSPLDALISAAQAEQALGSKSQLNSPAENIEIKVFRRSSAFVMRQTV